MRRLTTFLAVLAVVTFGCAAGTTPAPIPQATAQATPAPTATNTSVPRPSPVAVSARVTFDGTSCSYTGPTVIPFPAVLTVQFAPTKESYVVGITAIHSGTTEAQLNDPSNPPAGAGVPPFVYLDTHVFEFGSSTFEYSSNGVNPMALGGAKPTYDTFIVLCLKDMPGRPVGATTVLHLVPAGA
jgi:hypothetical protein